MVVGRAHAKGAHRFASDCSVRRRHQEVIEDAPAPGMDAATREELCCAAIRAAKAVDYVGAGTIEFIADDELVEITPKTIRVRKRFLQEHERKKASRAAA